MLQNQSFTDPQGQTFTDAVIRVKSADLNRNWYGNESETLSLDVLNPTSELTQSDSSDKSENLSARVEFAYWPNEEAFQVGRHPYTLSRVSGDFYSTTFTIDKETLLDDGYVDLSLEDKCLKYLAEQILPTLAE